MKTAPQVKTPCAMRWDEMRGDSRRRFCEDCQLHVHNLSAMSQRGIAQVLARGKHERVCITYTRRGDGTMVTRWDTIIELLLRPIRRGVAWLVAASIPIVLSACQTQSQLTGRFLPTCKKPQPKKTVSAEEQHVIVTGGVAINR
jgi:hypothetical protein